MQPGDVELGQVPSSAPGLMAGELLVTLGVFSVGFLLQQYRSINDYPAMIAIMIVILAVGTVVDALGSARSTAGSAVTTTCCRLTPAVPSAG